jgi:hypothetical protein
MAGTRAGLMLRNIAACIALTSFAGALLTSGRTDRRAAYVAGLIRLKE